MTSITEQGMMTSLPEMRYVCLREIGTSRFAHSDLEVLWAFTGGHPAGSRMHESSREVLVEIQLREPSA